MVSPSGRGEAPERSARTGVGYDLPRPALGRRPWFALLRRARRRRLFAFAMERERTTRLGLSQPWVVVRSDSWCSPPLTIALGVTDRWRGARPEIGPHGLVLWTQSIHGLGLVAPIEFCVLDDSGRVELTGHLERRGLVALRHWRWFVEMPAGSGLPTPGESVAVDRLDSWPDD